ncbi:hypothetical protein [Methyloligella solikamskensis]|uniref:Uncharacterized protein n=1 Tax=Methyloligella solikamskensis TaxID=1177756 RepID=A0ABW3J9Q8_9HYPH
MIGFNQTVLLGLTMASITALFGIGLALIEKSFLIASPKLGSSSGAFD